MTRACKRSPRLPRVAVARLGRSFGRRCTFVSRLSVTQCWVTSKLREARTAQSGSDVTGSNQFGDQRVVRMACRDSERIFTAFPFLMANCRGLTLKWPKGRLYKAALCAAECIPSSRSTCRIRVLLGTHTGTHTFSHPFSVGIPELGKSRHPWMVSIWLV
jgi:hypothetical protein